jgi:hypothetical protein
MSAPSDAEVFRAAVEGEGDEYLAAESALLASGSVDQILRPALQDEDPVARLVAQVVLDAAESETQPLEGAEQYLAAAERWFAPTILGTPPVRGVVSNLTATFGGRLGEYLAVRLVKVPSAPAWRQQVALGYLHDHPTPSATDALLRYASAATTAPGLQAVAARVLAASGDDRLAAKVAAERDRLASAGLTLPEPVAALIA